MTRTTLGRQATKLGVDVRPILPLATACAFHVGLLAAVGTLPPHPSASVPSPVPTAEIAVDATDLDLARVDEPLPSRVRTSSSVEGREARLDRAAAKVAPPSGLSDKAGPSRADDLPSVPEPAGSAWTFSGSSASTSSTFDLRAALSPDLVSPPSPPAALPPGASTTGGVAEGLAARDVEMGLGRGGPVLAAAEDAARASSDLVMGTATFDVAVLSNGSVVAQVLGASGSVASWSRVADAIGRSLDPRRVRLPPGGRGWRVVVKVDAQEKLADGRDVRSLHGVRASVTPSALQDQIEGKPGARGSSTGAGGPDNVGMGPADPPPVGGYLGRGPTNGGAAALQGIAARVVPTPTLSVSGKVCSASLTVTPLGVGLGGGCSLENLGTPSARVVSGQIVSESAL